MPVANNGLKILHILVTLEALMGGVGNGRFSVDALLTLCCAAAIQTH